MPLTPQQETAVYNRGGSLLVSAAAGSGKTKVLVERLFSYMEQEGCQVDDFLIITYTKVMRILTGFLFRDYALLLLTVLHVQPTFQASL